ncbi:MAG: hypothetical protein JWM27_393 [Gemmatimonadetes bacterium]|nr:hypothetical protein [Gemmatimonadota bacterium]
MGTRAWKGGPATAVAAMMALAAAACRDGAGTMPRGPVAEPAVQAMLDCRADVPARTVSCAPSAGLPGGVRGDVLLGGQGVYVLLANAPATFDAGTRIFQSDVTLKNLIGQAMGTTDGSTPVPGGVRVFFSSGPTNGVTVQNADGEDLFTSINQPYFAYTGILPTGATTAPKTWKWLLPAGVTGFTFTVYVSAPVAHPSGWVDLGADSVALQPGAVQQLAPVVRDGRGQEVPGATITWGSSAPGVASVDANGLLTASSAGTATLTATSGPRSASLAVRVAAQVAPGSAGAAAVQLTINSAKRSPISPFIYGLNFYDQADPFTMWGNATLPTRITLSRIGGNRLSAYNWENNASNAGSDYLYESDSYMGGGSTPGEAMRFRIAGATAKGAATLVTVPTLGWVAADESGPMASDDAGVASRRAAHFRQSLPRKPTSLSPAPDVSDGYTYQDEFVNWLNRQFPLAKSDPVKPIFYSLDNEPDGWTGTHREVRASTDEPTYSEMAQKTIDYAAAIKDVQPGATIFAPVTIDLYGLYTLRRSSPDPVAGSANFLDWYLDRMKAAEAAQGRRLLDVIDLHWYMQNAGVSNEYATQTSAVVQEREQAPRSLWDPTYTESSWVTDWLGQPIRLLPRIKAQIAAHYPGTKIAITEYYYYRGGDISGGIAQADALGVFGREGVFAATLWPNTDVNGAYGGNANNAFRYVFGAFNMFRNYDGAGHGFGNTSVWATGSDNARASVYASVDADNPVRMVIVAINKTTTAQNAAITISHVRAFTVAHVYTLTGASATPTAGADVPITQPNAFTYTMPAQSVTTLVLQ